MKSNETRCPNCFNDKGAASLCPICGFDENKTSLLPLPYRTLLDGKYLTGRILGFGRFGITYLGWDTRLEMHVAIKEYLPRELAGRKPNVAEVTPHTEKEAELFRDGLASFLEEAKALEKCRHDNVVRVRSFFEENNTAYLVMDYYEGMALDEYLKQKGGKIPESLAVKIINGVLEGLKEAHKQGYLHRDIKPENIYISRDDKPILIDFGAARYALRQQGDGFSVVLTPGYAPPEQYNRKGAQGPWTDLYGCGATLYNMVTSIDPPEAIERIQDDELISPDKLTRNLSERFTRATLKALAMNIDERFKTAEEFQRWLREDVVETVFYPCVNCGFKNQLTPKEDPKRVFCVHCGESLVVKSAPINEPVTPNKQHSVAKRLVSAMSALIWILLGAFAVLAVLFLPEIVQKASLLKEKWFPKPPILETAKPESPKPAPKLAAIAIDSIPSQATVLIDGQEKGVTPLRLNGLQPGRYLIELKKDAYETWQQTVDLKADESLPLTATLAPKLATLQIESVPSEAKVFINGQEKGVTPYQLSGVEAGQYLVELKKDAYETWKQTVDLKPDEALPLTATLERKLASLKIDSVPPGAVVLINGQEKGVTPYQASDLQVGDYRVELKKDSYATWKQTVQLKAGETLPIVATLEQAFSSLKIESDPSEAAVFIDGQEKGVTPYLTGNIPIGEHLIEIKKPSFQDWKKTVQFKGEEQLILQAALTPLSIALKIESVPSGAKILINNEEKGVTPYSAENLAPGQYAVELRKPPYQSWKQTVEIKNAENKPLKVKLELAPSWAEETAGIAFTLVKKGCFQMIAPFSGGVGGQTPSYEVCVDSFYIGKSEVTQKQWSQIMGKNPSQFQIHEDHPVENISWNNAIGFIEKLNEVSGLTFSLPTEAEWEYACRSGGKTQRFSGSEQVEVVAWYSRNSDRRTHRVMKREPNGLGLFDMSGNVWEWCLDDFFEQAYTMRDVTRNPLFVGARYVSLDKSNYAKSLNQLKQTQRDRIVRGGSWLNDPVGVQCALRDRAANSFRHDNYGFRVVLRVAQIK
jgi:serine/threonine protein kinase/formylglycine-generating enzyme required for sulfatase activity